MLYGIIVKELFFFTARKKLKIGSLRLLHSKRGYPKLFQINEYAHADFTKIFALKFRSQESHVWVSTDFRNRHFERVLVFEKIEIEIL